MGSSLSNDTILTHHSLADVFDKQYFNGMGFKNEKYLKEKKSKKHNTYLLPIKVVGRSMNFIF